MKKFLLYLFNVLMLCLFTFSLAFSQDVIVIEGGPQNAGLLETTINNDKDADGNRLNPNRVYMLKKNTVYFQNSAIEFGGPADSTATLNIIGEEGGNLPIILMLPLGAATRFENQIHGSLTVKNVYWPTQSLKNDAAALFKFYVSDIVVRCENLITDISVGYAPFHFRGVLGNLSMFLKDCYFRDNTQFENSWNFGIYARGDNGEPFDTLAIQNCTISNCGMPLFGKFNPVNVFIFDHNTVVNSCKYPIWHEQLKEAYITNNMFINANYEGECQSTANTQMSADGTFNGLINLHPIDERFWDNPPAMEDVVFLAANNLSHRSPFLDGYYNGEFNNVFDKPMSMRAWGDITDDMLPIPVENIPVKMFNDLTNSIIAEFPNYKKADNYDMDLDPLLVTKGMASQEVANEFIKHMRNNYGVAGPDEVRNKELMYFGDVNPGTVPGIEVEDGTGFRKISDLVEDFSYNASVRSTIDNKPLGALTWWDMDYDAEESLENIKSYYAALPTSVPELQESQDVSIYPNPASNVVQITSSNKLKTVQVYDLDGKLVSQYDLNGESTKSINISNLTPGIYIVEVETISGISSVSKIFKK
jgi:hypothetical protein